MWVADPHRDERAACRDHHQTAGETEGTDHSRLDLEGPRVAGEEPSCTDRKGAGKPKVGRASEEDIEGMKHLDKTADGKGHPKKEQISLETSGPNRAGRMRCP